MSVNAIQFFDWGLNNNKYYKCRFIIKNLLDRQLYTYNGIKTKIITSDLVNNKLLFYNKSLGNVEYDKTDYKAVGKDFICDVYIKLKKSDLENKTENLYLTFSSNDKIYQGTTISNRIVATLNNRPMKGSNYFSMSSDKNIVGFNFFLKNHITS